MSCININPSHFFIVFNCKPPQIENIFINEQGYLRTNSTGINNRIFLNPLFVSHYDKKIVSFNRSSYYCSVQTTYQSLLDFVVLTRNPYYYLKLEEI